MSNGKHHIKGNVRIGPFRPKVTLSIEDDVRDILRVSFPRVSEAKIDVAIAALIELHELNEQLQDDW